jgi:hypothetical protein
MLILENVLFERGILLVESLLSFLEIGLSRLLIITKEVFR